MAHPYVYLGLVGSSGHVQTKVILVENLLQVCEAKVLRTDKKRRGEINRRNERGVEERRERER